MQYSTLEINVISAKDLKDVNIFSKMDVYVVVSLSGDKQKAKTNVDRDGGTSPSWNFPMKFTIDESAARQNRLNLEFKLRCDRSLGGDKDMGEVYVPVLELLNSTGDGKSMQFVSYQVTKPSGKPEGVLKFSYKFSQKAAAGEHLVPEAKVHEPVTAYPAAPVVGPSALPYDGSYPPAPVVGPRYDGSYPPPPGGYSYAPPPPPPPSYQSYGYGYPPPPPGYGHPPPPGYGHPPPPGYGHPPPPGYVYPPAGQQSP